MGVKPASDGEYEVDGVACKSALTYVKDEAAKRPASKAAAVVGLTKIGNEGEPAANERPAREGGPEDPPSRVVGACARGRFRPAPVAGPTASS